MCTPFFDGEESTPREWTCNAHASQRDVIRTGRRRATCRWTPARAAPKSLLTNRASHSRSCPVAHGGSWAWGPGRSNARSVSLSSGCETQGSDATHATAGPRRMPTTAIPRHRARERAQARAHPSLRPNATACGFFGGIPSIVKDRSGKDARNGLALTGARV